MRLRSAVLSPASACVVAIVLLSSGPALAAKRASAAKPDASTAGSAPAAARSPVDANTADAAALQQVPGIGPAIAERIVAERARRPFTSLDDFDDRVKGVGDATLRRMVAGGLVVVAAPAAPTAARRAASPDVVRVAGGRAPAVPLGRVITVAGPDAAGATPRGASPGELPPAGARSAGGRPADVPSAPARR